jgi:DNA-binding transcriptional ArsR family regulator
VKECVLRHDARRAIVLLLRDGERTAGAIAQALRRPRPGVSHHLSCLLTNGIVNVRAVGQSRVYTLDFQGALGAWNDLLAESDRDDVPVDP